MVRCPLCGEVIPTGQSRCPRDGIAVDDATDPLIGATLAGRYRLLARLARGGMSAVYLARHALIDRLSAIKLLRRDLCDDPIQRDRFLREARAVNRINHENIVEIIDYGESEDGRVFLVMEYLPGESLQQRLTRGPLAPARALHIAAQIASGLGRAHQMGVIHRDLKPDNVILLPVLAPDGLDRVKLLDFGIAKLLDQPSLTATDKIFGTPGYIAPEYAAGGPLDGRTDLYSLGVVLYEMVTAQLPFDVEYPADLLLKHMLEPPIPPRVRLASVPPEVDRLILRALEKDPANRFRDAFHMVDELERVRAQLIARVGPDSLRSSGQFMVPNLAGAGPSISARASSPTNAPVSSPSAMLHAPPPPAVGSGVQGARAWGRYLEALRADARERSGGQLDAGTTAHFERMAQVCTEMHERVSRVEQHRARLLALEARGKDFRSTIGRALDELGRDLSTKARTRDEIAAERERIELAREALNARARAGDRAASGESDAMLWQLAACDEVLREAVNNCEDIEFQLRELGRQLERLSESLESDQSDLVTDMNATLAALVDSDATLRKLAARGA